MTRDPPLRREATGERFEQRRLFLLRGSSALENVGYGIEQGVVEGRFGGAAQILASLVSLEKPLEIPARSDRSIAN